jgi:hypothetical protein
MSLGCIFKATKHYVHNQLFMSPYVFYFCCASFSVLTTDKLVGVRNEIGCETPCETQHAFTNIFIESKSLINLFIYHCECECELELKLIIMCTKLRSTKFVFGWNLKIK